VVGSLRGAGTTTSRPFGTAALPDPRLTCLCVSVWIGGLELRLPTSQRGAAAARYPQPPHRMSLSIARDSGGRAERDSEPQEDHESVADWQGPPPGGHEAVAAQTP
jgi:hypothetical protein